MPSGSRTLLTPLPRGRRRPVALTTGGGAGRTASGRVQTPRAASSARRRRSEPGADGAPAGDAARARRRPRRPRGPRARAPGSDLRAGTRAPPAPPRGPCGRRLGLPGGGGGGAGPGTRARRGAAAGNGRAPRTCCGRRGSARPPRVGSRPPGPRGDAGGEGGLPAAAPGAGPAGGAGLHPALPAGGPLGAPGRASVRVRGGPGPVVSTGAAGCGGRSRALTPRPCWRQREAPGPDLVGRENANRQHPGKNK